MRGRSGRAARDATGRLAWAVWASLALLAPLVCFVLGSVYTGRLSARIGSASLSIATNGAPSVVYLSTMRDDIRRIQEQAMLAGPRSVAQDRAAIRALNDDLDGVEMAYRDTPDYPGERLAYETMRRLRTPFFAAVERLLARADAGRPASAEDLERLRAVADDLTVATGVVVDINAREVASAGNLIAGLRRRALWLMETRDALAFAFVVAGTVLGIHAARQQAALAEGRRRLDQERLAELDVFAGRVAHDLRDLLGGILMRASMGERAKTLEAATETLAHVTRQSHRMSATIDALLTFARAAARPEPGAHSDAARVMDEVVTDVQLLAAEARTEIYVEPPRAVVVACDPVVLGVVLSNLVRNALKYMGDGAVRRITLRGRRQSLRLRFEVEDTGPGLPPGAEARVFDPFVRLREAQHAAGGIGLGLATVKRLVEANGGMVGVDSRPGAGCRFWFTLPLAA